MHIFNVIGYSLILLYCNTIPRPDTGLQKVTHFNADNDDSEDDSIAKTKKKVGNN